MSPPERLTTDVVELSISVIDGDLSFERFVDLDPRPGEAEALGLGRDLEVASVPLHDVIVADAAFVDEAADAVEVLGSGAPGFFRLARRTAEAPVVVGKKTAEHLVGRFQIGRSGEAEFTGEAVLEGAPQAFDAALGLRAVGRDVSDAQLSQCAAELSRFAASGELFFDRPVLVVADEDASSMSIRHL
jgi:hypothetical protein